MDKITLANVRVLDGERLLEPATSERSRGSAPPPPLRLRGGAPGRGLRALPGWHAAEDRHDPV